MSRASSLGDCDAMASTSPWKTRFLAFTRMLCCIRAALYAEYVTTRLFSSYPGVPVVAISGKGSAWTQAREHTRPAEAKTDACARLCENLRSRSLETPFLLVWVLVDGEHLRLGCGAFTFTLALLVVVLLRLRGAGGLAIRVSGKSLATVDGVLELAGAELGRLHRQTWVG